MSVSCVCVCAIAKIPLPCGLETSGQRVYHKYWHTSRNFLVFVVLIIIKVFNFFFSRIFGCFQTNLLCLMGKLADGGSVAVGISDR